MYVHEYVQEYKAISQSSGHLRSQVPEGNGPAFPAAINCQQLEAIVICVST